MGMRFSVWGCVFLQVRYHSFSSFSFTTEVESYLYVSNVKKSTF